MPLMINEVTENNNIDYWQTYVFMLLFAPINDIAIDRV